MQPGHEVPMTSRADHGRQHPRHIDELARLIGIGVVDLADPERRRPLARLLRVVSSTGRRFR
jgi:hypothetical protein